MARGMDEVRLDEGDAPPETAAKPVRTARRWRRLVVAGVVVVVGLGTALAVQRVLDARQVAADEALAARYADVAGVVAPLGPGLTTAWRATGADADVVGSGVEVGGVLVGMRADGDEVVVAALDPADGSPRWATPPVRIPTPDLSTLPWLLAQSLSDGVPDEVAAGARQSLLDQLGRMVLAPQTCTATSDGLVVCDVRRVLRGDMSVVTTTLVVVDPADGSVRDVRTYGLDESVAVVGDLVAVARGGDATGAPVDGAAPVRWVLEALDATTGRSGWRWPGPDVVPGDWLPPDVGGQGDVVLLTSSDREWAFAADGTRLAELATGDGFAVLAGGRLVPTNEMSTTDDGLVAQDSVLSLGVDDGSLPGLVLGARTGPGGALVVARDASDDVVWTAPDARDPHAVLEGRLLVGTPRGTALVDGRDGSTIWSVDGPRLGPFVITDGRVVLVTAGQAVQALDLASGEVRWERTADELGVPDVRELLVEAGVRRVLVRTSDGYAVLG